MTQPRRISAIGVADRIASEMATGHALDGCWGVGLEGLGLQASGFMFGTAGVGFGD